MPSSGKRLCVQHILGGGLATDRGSGVDAPLSGSGQSSAQVRIPFLLRAENIEYTLNGGYRKRDGTAKYNSTVINSGEEIRAMFEYTKIGTSGSTSRYMVCHSGTTVQADANDGSFSSIITGLTDNSTPSYAQFKDLLVIASDEDAPRKWDGSTAASLGGSPPSFAFACVHKRHLFVAGVDGNPDTLYYSDLDDPENWSTGDSGSITVNRGDGDRITGLYSQFDRLVIFKGPNKGSIHFLTGSTDSDFALTTGPRGVGAVAHNLIFPFANDVGFVWADGTVRSLVTTEKFGSFEAGSLSRDINRGLLHYVNTQYLHRGWAVDHPENGEVHFTLPWQASTVPNLHLVMDYRFIPTEGQPRWSTQTMTTPYSLVRKSNPSDGNRHAIYTGGADGFIRRLASTNFNIDGGATEINAYVRTPYMTYAMPHIEKTLVAVGVGIVPKGDYTSTVSWIRDSDAEQSTTVDQNGAAVLDVFELDGDALEIGDYVHRFSQTEEGGQFRTITIQVSDTTVNQGVEVHSIDAVIEVNGEVLENP